MSDHAFALKDDDADDEQRGEDVESVDNDDADDDLEETPSAEQEPEVSDDDDDRAPEDDETEVVTLEWIPSDDEPSLPVPDAIEANGRALDDVYDLVLDARDAASEAKGAAEEAKRAPHDQFDNELETLRARLERLEAWKQDAIEALDGQGQEIGLLLTASDIADAGMCPECGNAPLEVQNRALRDSTIECSNDDCDHVAAKMR